MPEYLNQVCQECGGLIKRTDRRMKSCQDCINAKIAESKRLTAMGVKRYEDPDPVPGFIYMIRFDGNLCKIGRTVNLANRLVQYRREYPNAEYLHTFPAYDTYKAEDFFRGMYRRERDLNYGIEWYWLAESDIEWFKTIKSQCDLTEEVDEAREAKFWRGEFWDIYRE